MQYDWYDLPAEAIPALRDSLLSLLGTPTLASAIRTQLVVALSDCIAQMTTWPDPITDLITMWGESLDMVPTLLKLLSILPEELFENDKLSLQVGGGRGVLCLATAL